MQAEAAMGPELDSGWWGLLGSGYGWQAPEWAQLRCQCLGEGRVGPEWPVQTPALSLQTLTYRPSWENLVGMGTKQGCRRVSPGHDVGRHPHPAATMH